MWDKYELTTIDDIMNNFNFKYISRLSSFMKYKPINIINKTTNDSRRIIYDNDILSEIIYSNVPGRPRIKYVYNIDGYIDKIITESYNIIYEYTDNSVIRTWYNKSNDSVIFIDKIIFTSNDRINIRNGNHGSILTYTFKDGIVKTCDMMNLTDNINRHDIYEYNKDRQLIGLKSYDINTDRLFISNSIMHNRDTITIYSSYYDNNNDVNSYENNVLLNDAGKPALINLNGNDTKLQIILKY